MHEKGTYPLALFTNLKQKFQIYKHFVNSVRRNSWDTVILHIQTHQQVQRMLETYGQCPCLLVTETIGKKYSKTHEASLKSLAQGELKLPILMDQFTNVYTKTSLINKNPEDRV